MIFEDTFILVQLIAGTQNTVNTKCESGWKGKYFLKMWLYFSIYLLEKDCSEFLIFVILYWVNLQNFGYIKQRSWILIFCMYMTICRENAWWKELRSLPKTFQFWTLQRFYCLRYFMLTTLHSLTDFHCGVASKERSTKCAQNSVLTKYMRIRKIDMNIL